MPLIKGTIEDERGTPVPEAIIAIESGTVPCPDKAILSDEQGNFNINLPVGHFCLAGRSQDGGYGTVEFDSDTDKHLLIHLTTHKL